MAHPIHHILVTGSSGMIGTRLCEKLMAHGYHVIGADIRPNIWNAEIDKRTIRVDLRHREEVLSKLPKNIDMILHLAANARVHKLVVDPTLALDNITMLFQVLEFARLNNVGKFLFTSSREVYGDVHRRSYKERMITVSGCESAYTASKISGEALVHSYRRLYNIDAAIVRLSNVYGMYDISDRITPLFIERIAKGLDITIFGKEKVLDFTYIDDAVAGIMGVIRHFDRAKSEVLNIADGRGISLLYFAEYLQKLLEQTVAVQVQKNRPGEITRYVANIRRATKRIGFRPQVSVEEGLQASVGWYLRYFGLSSSVVKQGDHSVNSVLGGTGSIFFSRRGQK